MESTSQIGIDFFTVITATFRNLYCCIILFYDQNPPFLEQSNLEETARSFQFLRSEAFTIGISGQLIPLMSSWPRYEQAENSAEKPTWRAQVDPIE